MKQRCLSFIRLFWSLALVCVLVAGFYQWWAPGRRVVQSIEEVNERIDQLIQATVDQNEGWLSTTDPERFINQMWAVSPCGNEWFENDPSFYLLEGSQTRFWAHNRLADTTVLSLIAHWSDQATETGQIRLESLHLRRFLVFSRKGIADRRLVVVVHLYDPYRTGANPVIFDRPDTRIEMPYMSVGELCTLAGQQARIEWPSYNRREGWVVLVGCIGVLAALLGFSLWLSLHTSRARVWINLGGYFLFLVVLRLVLYAVDYPYGVGHSWGSLYPVLITELMLLIFFVYAYLVRQKAVWHMVRWSRTGQWVAMVLTMGVVVASIVYFHCAMIHMLYCNKMEVEIHNIFSMSLSGFLFYLTAGIFATYRILFSFFARTVFIRFGSWIQMGVSLGLLVLMVLPFVDQMLHTVWILFAAHFLFVLLSLGRSRHASRIFVADVVVMAFYVAFLAVSETSIAKLNDVKHYAKQLAEGNFEHQTPYVDVASSIVSSNSVILRPQHQVDLGDVVPFLKTRQSQVVERNGVIHVVEPNADGWVVIVSYPVTSWLQIFSLLCYIFLGFYVVPGFMLRLLGIDVYGWGSIKMLSTRIRFIVIGVVLCAMVVVALVVYRYLDNNYKSRKREVLNASASTLVDSFRRYCRDTSPPDSVWEHAALRDSLILTWYAERGSAMNAWVTFYDTQGRKVGGGKRSFYSPALMSSAAYRALAYEGLPYFDRYGDDWSQVYVSLFVEGRKVGYLNITSHDKGNTYTRFLLLGNIVNVFVILIIVLVSLSVLLYAVVTRPLRMLTTSLGGIGKLQKIPIPEGQKMNDEVGMLIVQYNRTIDYLEASYRALARSEREGAWREMARQVAHEIKNPLTPMQLKIQLLQRIRATGDKDRINEQLDSTLEVLLEQIRVLSQIASDFSDLARFDQTAMVRVELGPLVQHQVALFDHTSGISLSVEVPPIPIYVMGAYVPLSRLLVNVLQNAMQSIPDRGTIHLRLFEREGWAIVEISDTGKGIEPGLIDRIFEPNFTTKSSGSGLGLAMCRQIVASMNGMITVNSELGVGSIFTISLPLA